MEAGRPQRGDSHGRSERTRTVIESSARSRVRVRELLGARELLYFLAWRDVKVRYKQTIAGVLWVVLQPLLTTAVFTIFFGRLVKVGSDGAPYPVFAFVGLLAWTFFQNAVGTSSQSLVGNAGLITKIYFPRVLVPTAAVVAAILDLGVTVVMLAVLMAVYGLMPGLSLLAAPLLLALLIVLAWAVGVLFAGLMVEYRDIRFVVTFGLQLTLFLSPVIYPPTVVPSGWRWLLELNPLTGILGGLRAGVLQTPFDWSAIAWSIAGTAGLVLLAVATFASLERRFADVA